MEMSAKGRKRKSAKGRKKGATRAQKSAKERFRVKIDKQPGLKQPGLGTPKVEGDLQ